MAGTKASETSVEGVVGATITVWLEPHSLLIRQRIEGSLTPEDYDQLEAKTEEAVAQLPPGSKVRILADLSDMGPVSLAVRRAGAQRFRPETHKLAAYGGNRLKSMVHRFLSIVIGQNRMRFFTKEQEARAWLEADMPNA